MRIIYKGALVLTMLLGVGTLYAQNNGEGVIKKSKEYQEVTLNNGIWSRSGIAAGVGVEKLRGLGIVEATGYYQDGDYHRAQEASSDYGAIITSSSYSKLSKYLYGYGSFTFKANRESDRAWSDMRNIYSGLPYTYGSAIKGEYDNQMFSLTGRLSTVELGGFTYGVGVDYSTFDMSRLIDPRPRTLALETKLSPSVTYRLGSKSHIAAEFCYEYKKDRMSGITTVQDADLFEYYLFSGLENYSLTNQLSLVAQQQYSNSIGYRLAYGYSANNLKLLFNVGYKSTQDDLINSTNDRRSYGDYYADIITFGFNGVITNNKVQHVVNANAEYNAGSSLEFVQENQNVTDPNGNVSSQWVTLYEYITYRNFKSTINIDYKLYSGNISKSDYDFYLGASVESDMFENKYILPASNQKVSLLTAGVNGGVRIFSKDSNKLNFNAKIAYRTNLENQLNVADKNIIYENVLLVDYNYFATDVISGYADLTYSKIIGKGNKAQSAFLKLFYNHNYTKSLGKMATAGVSLGIYL